MFTKNPVEMEKLKYKKLQVTRLRVSANEVFQWLHWFIKSIIY